MLLKTFSFPLITCVREYSLFRFVFSHCSNKSSRALYFSHTDLFALPKNISGLYFGCRFLLAFYMPELLTFSGLPSAGRSCSRCCLRSANHSAESRSDLSAHTGKHWHGVQPDIRCHINKCMLQCHQKFFVFLLYVCSIVWWVLKISSVRALYVNCVWNNWL